MIFITITIIAMSRDKYKQAEQTIKIKRETNIMFPLLATLDTKLRPRAAARWILSIDHPEVYGDGVGGSKRGSR